MSRPVSALAPYLYGALIASLLCAFALWDGFPLITQDTPAYISRPASVLATKAPALAGPWADPGKTAKQAKAPGPAAVAAQGPAGFDERIMASRSIYYGLILFVFDAIGGLWAATAFQAFVAGACIGLLVWRGLGWRSPWAILGLGAGLALGTGASLFAGLMMPDLLAATTILAITVLAAFWDRLGRADRAILVLCAIAGVVSHDSTLLIAAGLTACIALGWLVWRKAAVGKRFGPAALAGMVIVLAGVGTQIAFTKAAVAFSGYPPARLPYFTAHLGNTPAGAAFIQADCRRSARWAVCPYADDLPRDWNAFLFAPGPGFGGSSSVEKLAISEDDIPLTIAFAKARPLDALGLALRETGRQLVMFGLYDVEPRDMAPSGFQGVPAKVAASVQATRLWTDPRPLAAFSWATIGVAIASLIAIAAALATGWRKLAASRLRTTAALVVIGLVGNAAICGILASPYNRFQARVMWLIPMLAICLLVTLWMQGRSRTAAPETF
jgi:hypothetical protein